jgi:hypothetical protein
MLERGEKIEVLVDKTDQLLQRSDSFRSSAKQVKVTQQRSKWRLTFIIVLIILVNWIRFLTYLVVGGCVHYSGDSMWTNVAELYQKSVNTASSKIVVILIPQASACSKR